MPTAIIAGIGEPLQIELEFGVDFRIIRGYERNAVGDDGSIWSCRGGVWKKRKISKWPPTPKVPTPYGFVGLNQNGKQYLAYVHRIVLISFVGPPPTPEHECRHADGNIDNCRRDNLLWGTPVENASDRIIHGTAPIGSNNPRATITDEIVMAIRQDRALGMTLAKLMEKYGLPKATTSHIYRRYTWGHLP